LARGELVALGQVDASVLSIARTSLTHMAGLIARDTGIAEGLPDRAYLAAGEGGGSGMSGTASDQRPDEIIVRMRRGKQR
jgi:hypothetical protein